MRTTLVAIVLWALATIALCVVGILGDGTGIGLAPFPGHRPDEEPHGDARGGRRAGGR
jgi:hypothetical protein